MTYFVIVEQYGVTASLECETLEEAQKVYQSFVNYGKYSNVKIEVRDEV